MKTSWNLLISPAVAGLIGIVGVVLAIYKGFFYERKPELAVSVDSMSKVFDLYRPVGGLEVSYSGEDLRTSKKNLWVMTATVKNLGNADIRKGDYDDKVPLGLKIQGAVIAEHPTIKTSTEYLAKNLTVTSSEGQIFFSPVILEGGDSFEITALLLGSDTSKPTVLPTGKVAGIKSIVISTPESPSPEKSVWAQAYGGTSLWVQVIRAPSYFLGFILSLLMIAGCVAASIAPFGAIGARRRAHERQKKAREYRRHEELRKDSRYLLDQYVTSGDRGLSAVARYLKVQSRRQALLAQLDGRLDEAELERVVRAAAPYRLDEDRTEEHLKSAHLADGDGFRIATSSSLANALDDLCQFLDLDVKKLAQADYGIEREEFMGASIVSVRADSVS